MPKQKHPNPSSGYSELSISITKKLDKEEKKNGGIFFTPPDTITKNLRLLDPHMSSIKNILEPSCGSCEYISALVGKLENKKGDNISITGIEQNKTIFDMIKHGNTVASTASTPSTPSTVSIKLYNEDFLKYSNDTRYDLIIGNPPYFVMDKKDVDKMYYKYFDGRPNIFLLFIIKSLHMLSPNGILSFVLPKSFANCLYYDKTRKYIMKNYTILHIVECNDAYIETKQETIILIIKNTKPIVNDTGCAPLPPSPSPPSHTDYYMDVDRFTLFGTRETILKLRSLYANSTTLKKLGFCVSVGNVVWNQCKKELTYDNTKTLLIYSSDIRNKKLEIQTYTNEQKKNYINKKGETQPLLVINRGYGVGEYKFEYCLINEHDTETVEYLIENHLICIRYENTIAREELICLYKKIITSFESGKTREFIQLYFGNNAINTTELCEIFPIY